VDASGDVRRDDAGSRSRADEAMDRYAGGEDTAFSAVYDELAPRLLHFAARQLHSRTAAEDVVQQALLQIHLARGHFTAGAAVLPWAYAIARRLVIDVTRRRRHDEPGGAGADGAEAASGAVAADVALDDKRSEAALARDLLHLPAAHREAFELLKLEGLSVAECAEVLGITQGMAKIRAHRATVALRAAHLRRQGRVTLLHGGAHPGDEEGPP
jgi:RNA polymerase sigma-70 factor (ECF subfamily)